MWNYLNLANLVISNSSCGKNCNRKKYLKCKIKINIPLTLVVKSIFNSSSFIFLSKSKTKNIIKKIVLNLAWLRYVETSWNTLSWFINDLKCIIAWLNKWVKIHSKSHQISKHWKDWILNLDKNMETLFWGGSLKWDENQTLT